VCGVKPPSWLRKAVSVSLPPMYSQHTRGPSRLCSLGSGPRYIIPLISALGFADIIPTPMRNRLLFHICTKCSSLYQNDGQDVRLPTDPACWGGRTHTPAAPDGSPTPYEIRVTSWRPQPSPEKQSAQWPIYSEFRTCRKCGVLCLHDKVDHGNCCVVDAHQHDLEDGIPFVLFHLPIEQEDSFKLCVVCGCLYHRTIGDQHCFDRTFGGGLKGEGVFFMSANRIHHSPDDKNYQKIKTGRRPWMRRARPKASILPGQSRAFKTSL
jgi:hypothetical protein